MCNIIRCVASAMLLMTPSLATAQQGPVSGLPPSRATLTALVDSVVHASLLDQGVPSVSIAVMRGDKMLVQRAWGLADVASRREADPSTVYALASNSKQFTAALILRLVDGGRLTLEDPIGQHLSGLPPAWRPITIEQLLNHTSGLQRGGFVDMSRMEEDVPGDSILARAALDSMAARPGTTFLYSNTGYVILGVLIETLYGKPYGAALRDEIALPLGLTSLRYCADIETGAGATGYRIDLFDGALSPPPALHPSQQLGASGICSTAADLAKWNVALHGGRVLSGSSYSAMTTPRGVAGSYGLGLAVGRAQWGDPHFAHGGQEVSGFTSENGWYPADSLSVTMLYNTNPRVAVGGTHIIAALALGHTPPATPGLGPLPGATTPATGIVGDEARREFVGAYQIGPGVVFRVDFEDGAFVVTTPGGEKIPMVHESEATYALGKVGSGDTITFLADAEGRVAGFLVRNAGAPDQRLRKIR